MTHFVYKVTNNINGKFYIGITNNVDRRWKQHKNEATRNRRISSLHSSIRKHGEDNFSIEVIYCSKHREDVQEKETHFIREYKTTDNSFGYNLTDGGEGTCFTPEVRAKIAAGNKGRKHSDETRAKVSAALTGRPVSAETRKKISEANKGTPPSLLSRMRSSEVNTGVSPSIETRKKISIAGKGRVVTPETRKKIAAGHTKVRILSTPEGITVVHDLKQFCKDNNLNWNHTRDVFHKQVTNKTKKLYKDQFYCLGVQNGRV